MRRPPISLVLATGSECQIGLNGALPWHLPDDLKHFKELTLNETVIMGRDTFLSIGRPLPQRDNIIVSKKLGYIPGARVATSLGDALSKANPNKMAYVIGGISLWEEALPMADCAVISLVDYQGEADRHLSEAFFADIRERFILKQLKSMTGFTITEWINPASDRIRR